eukprot:gnl/MRDRNA2_/MRDRNA2_124363_c0_seq1.p1 gnl/MRDRNA2_/MRDRNA2_124363_c0~~gnl/MRDRNA2_/MRDRNA2_124363_c0_seq1.p1  ORF type:complete len:182 (+),score=17.39 gnl/MRDRNA2_/MRDRNA2_124363_c0_seq1:132-677(+)
MGIEIQIWMMIVRGFANPTSECQDYETDRSQESYLYKVQDGMDCGKWEGPLIANGQRYQDASVEECKITCSSSIECDGFVYVKTSDSGSPGGRCWFRFDTGPIDESFQSRICYTKVLCRSAQTFIPKAATTIMTTTPQGQLGDADASLLSPASLSSHVSRPMRLLMLMLVLAYLQPLAMLM